MFTLQQIEKMMQYFSVSQVTVRHVHAEIVLSLNQMNQS